MPDTFLPLADHAPLIDALAEPSEGGGAGWLVTGEAGIGKTSLVRHLRSVAEGRGVPTVIGRAVVSDPEPLRPLRELAIGLAALTGARPAEPGPYSSALRALLGVAGDGSTALGVPRLVLAEALLELAASAASADGLLLVVEDLHHADSDTIGVAAYLLDHLQGSGVAGVFTTRDVTEVAPFVESARASHAARIVELRRWTDDEVARLLATEGVPVDLVPDVVRSADGLPFMAAELAKESMAGGGRSDVPQGAADALARSFRAAGHEVCRLVRAFAVADTGDLDLLCRAGGWSRDEAAELIEEARHHQVLAPDPPLRFRHDLLRGATLEGLDEHERGSLLETMLADIDPGGPLCRTVARLAREAGQFDLAAEAAVAAADQDYRAGRFASAESWLQGVSAVPGQSVSPGVLARLVRVRAARGDLPGAEAAADDLLPTCTPLERDHLRLVLGGAAYACFRPDRIAAHLEELTRSSVNHPGIAAGTALLTAQLATLTRSPDSVKLADAAAIAFSDLGDLAGRAGVELVRSLALEHFDAEAADQAATDAHGLAVQAGEPHLALAADAQLASRRFWRTGELAEVRRVARAATDMGALPVRVPLDLAEVGHAAVRFDPQAMRSASDVALATAQETGLQALFGIIACMRGMAEDVAGEAERAEAVWASVADQSFLAAELATTRAQGPWARDDPATTLHYLERAAELFRDKPPGQGPWRGVLTLLRAHAGRDDIETGISLGGWEHLDAAAACLAHAIVTGRRGDTEVAEKLVRDGTARYAQWYGAETMRHVAMRYVAEAAVTDGWGKPERWLTDVVAWCDEPPTTAIADAARALLHSIGAVAASPAPSVERELRRLGVTVREREVLDLLGTTTVTRELADRLYLSPRTVDKHIERLRQKFGVRSRTELIEVARSLRPQQ